MDTLQKAEERGTRHLKVGAETLRLQNVATRKGKEGKVKEKEEEKEEEHSTSTFQGHFEHEAVCSETRMVTWSISG